MEEEDFIDPYLPPSPYGVVWHSPGSRVYTVGTDRGMLYPINEAPGVPWMGLVSVEEEPINGEIKPIHIDGVRRRNQHFLEEFSATITAYSAPKEFAPCEGEREIVPGLFLGQQHREEFGFSYRSFIGNDVGELGKDYELHIIYNALAEPTSITNSTISDSPEAVTRSWKIETTPLDVMDNQPSARIRLDSRFVDPERLMEIQYILYGTLTEEPRLPLIDEIFEILSREEPEEEIEDIPWEPDIEETP